MSRLLLVSIILISFGCKKSPDRFIAHLQGYWEIEKVKLASGKEHTYQYNMFIDYFEMKDSVQGFRKKLKPTLEGKFEDSTSSEHFVLKIEHDSLNIYYSTEFSHWKETILSATDAQLKIINAHKDIFIYKPYTPLNLN